RAAAAFIDACGPLQRARHPSAVARRCSVTGDLALEHDDAQRRPRALEVVGAPQPRVAGADDRHVRLAGTLERRARIRRATERAPPEPELAVSHQPPASGTSSTLVPQFADAA